MDVRYYHLFGEVSKLGEITMMTPPPREIIHLLTIDPNFQWDILAHPSSDDFKETRL